MTTGEAPFALVPEQVNAIALASVQDFRRDSDLFGEGVLGAERSGRSVPRWSTASRPEKRKWPWREFWPS